MHHKNQQRRSVVDRSEQSIPDDGGDGGGRVRPSYSPCFPTRESRMRNLIVEGGDQQLLPRGRSWSPGRVSPSTSILRSSKSFVNFEATRKDYNRQVGQSLNSDKGKSVMELTASSLLWIDKLLDIVKLDPSIEPPPPIDLACEL